jgi:hypothetical protein
MLYEVSVETRGEWVEKNSYLVEAESEEEALDKYYNGDVDEEDSHRDEWENWSSEPDIVACENE